MKNSIIIIALFISPSLFGIENEKIITSKVKSATVFLKGAQVFRQGRTSLKPGTNKIIFDDVSPFLNPKSIQASASNGVLILDVKHTIFYKEPKAQKPQIIPERIQKEINGLNDSILIKQYELNMITTLKNNFLNEKKLIINNKVMRGEGRNDSLEVLIKAVNFYRERLGEIEAKLFKVKVKEHKLSNNFNKMKERLAELKRYNHNVAQPVVSKRKIHRVVVTVNSEVAASSTIKVNYLVDNAGWHPSYDLRASGKEEISLTYKATVFQKTGENWDNIKLTLSTYNQNCSFTIPTLPTWDLFDKKTRIPKHQSFSSGYMSLDTVMIMSNANIPQEARFDNGKLRLEQATPVDDFLAALSNNQMQSALNNIEFNIEQPYSIQPDGQEVLMVVKNEKLKSNFEYFGIPKVNTDAFLLAKITGWEDMNLLHAKANIYFNNTYVGETYLNPNVLTDTLQISLAREKGIVTSRKKVSDDDKKSATGKKVSREITIELVVKNNKNETVNMELKDQIPISKQKGVTVKSIDLDHAELDDNTGMLTWNLQLKPNETKIISFTYKVEYNKDMDVL
jgi:uncharacterized protein (TIGR02231 family)